MKKNLILVATLAMAMGTATTMFTSCSSDDDLETSAGQTNNISTRNHGRQDGTYTYQNYDGSVVISVTIKGNNAIVTRGSEVSDQPNAQVVMEKSYRGYLKMNDNSLGVDMIPFTKGSSTIELDFTGTNILSGNSVVLKQSTVSRASNGQTDEDAIMTDGAKQLVEAMSKTLIKFGLNAFLGDFGDALSDPFLEWAFPGDDASVQQYKALEEQISGLSVQLQQLGDQQSLTTLKNEFTEHWECIYALKEHNKHFADVFATCETQEDLKKELNNWALATVNKNSVMSGLTTMMAKYSNQVYTFDWFGDLDEYLIRTHGFLEQSYATRDLYRVEDAEVFTQSVQFMCQYYKSQKLDENSSSYKSLLTAFENYAKGVSASVYTKPENIVVCTIPGAYCTMQSTVKTKVLGTGITFGEDKGYDHSIINDNDDYWNRDGNWRDSYVYSDKGLYPDNENEIKTKCLTKDQASNIVNYYGGKTNLKDILTNEAKVKGLSNNAMLLNGTCNSDWSHYSWAWNDATANIAVPTWNYNKNAYSDSDGDKITFSSKTKTVFDWGVVTHKWFIFKEHTGNKYDYTQKIAENGYTSNGSFSDTSSLMNYIKHIEDRE